MKSEAAPLVQTKTSSCCYGQQVGSNVQGEPQITSSSSINLKELQSSYKSNANKSEAYKNQYLFAMNHISPVATKKSIARQIQAKVHAYLSTDAKQASSVIEFCTSPKHNPSPVVYSDPINPKIVVSQEKLASQMAKPNENREKANSYNNCRNSHTLTQSKVMMPHPKDASINPSHHHTSSLSSQTFRKYLSSPILPSEIVQTASFSQQNPPMEKMSLKTNNIQSTTMGSYPSLNGPHAFLTASKNSLKGRLQLPSQNCKKQQPSRASSIRSPRRLSQKLSVSHNQRQQSLQKTPIPQTASSSNLPLQSTIASFINLTPTYSSVCNNRRLTQQLYFPSMKSPPIIYEGGPSRWRHGQPSASIKPLGRQIMQPHTQVQNKEPTFGRLPVVKRFEVINSQPVNYQKYYNGNRISQPLPLLQTNKKSSLSSYSNLPDKNAQQSSSHLMELYSPIKPSLRRISAKNNPYQPQNRPLVSPISFNSQMSSQSLGSPRLLNSPLYSPRGSQSIHLSGMIRHSKTMVSFYDDNGTNTPNLKQKDEQMQEKSVIVIDFFKEGALLEAQRMKNNPFKQHNIPKEDIPFVTIQARPIVS